MLKCNKWALSWAQWARGAGDVALPAGKLGAEGCKSGNKSSSGKTGRYFRKKHGAGWWTVQTRENLLLCFFVQFQNQNGSTSSRALASRISWKRKTGFSPLFSLHLDFAPHLSNLTKVYEHSLNHKRWFFRNDGFIFAKEKCWRENVFQDLDFR